MFVVFQHLLDNRSSYGSSWGQVFHLLICGGNRCDLAFRAARFGPAGVAAGEIRPEPTRCMLYHPASIPSPFPACPILPNTPVPCAAVAVRAVRTRITVHACSTLPSTLSGRRASRRRGCARSR
ncbi:transcriptional regulator, TetR family domain protein [Thauera sp. SWB20]|nr:transcriptional regulator, TetR family domain protein [Thauera sp. SWB20]